MGSGIQGPPNQYSAGLDFDYSVWTAGTKLTLVNVPWNNDYRDVVRFDDRTALNNYIDSLVSGGISIDKMTYAKPGQDIYLGIAYNRVNRFNYLRASNPLMPITGDIQKDFYYFILECEYINPTTTRLRLQLDVWQTYIYDVTIGNCYIQRGHIGIANSNQFNNYGRDYLTVPEGMDIGNEYQQIARKSEKLIQNAAFPGVDATNGDVLVITTADTTTSGGTPDAPVIKSATGSLINGLPSGADFFCFTDITTFWAFIGSLSDKPWVSQGIISITLVPSMSRYAGLGGAPVDGEKIESYVGVPITNKLWVNWRNDSALLSQIPARYQSLKKLFTFPYMAIEMTTWNGNPAILKPESWNSADAEILERASFVPPNQSVQFMPRGYNAVTGAPIDNQWDMTDDQLASLPSGTQAVLRDKGDDSGDYLDMMVQIANFPSLPVVNNMALGYLTANRNQIAYGFQSADWSQQRALAGAQASYDVASGAMRQRSEQSNIDRYGAIAQNSVTNRLLNAQAATQAVGSFAKGAAGGAAFGGTPAAMGAGAALGGIDAVTGAVGAGQQIGANNENLAIAQSTSAQQAANDNTQTALARDTNVGLARFAARGDYANEIAGINAKVRDAALIQPSVSGQFGGESINIETNKLELSLRFKMIDKANMAKVCEYWLRYGYAIDRFIRPPQNLKVMTKFSYWKMSETYITAATIPEGHKQAIRGIMEKGFTNWSNPADIGQIDTADNAPLVGISY